MEGTITKGRERITSLFDAGTFVEMGAYVRRSTEAYDAVVCGYGAVGGRLVFAFAQDADRTGGAFDGVGALKIEKLYEQAIRNGAPVVGVFDSTGTVVDDGAPALSAYGRLMACVSRASGVVPQVALIAGVCNGMNATVAAMFDLTVTVEGQSEWATTPAFLGGENTDWAAVKAASEAEAVRAVRTLIDRLPQNNADASDVDCADDPARVANVNGKTGVALVEALADAGSVTVLYGGVAPEIVTALSVVGGKRVGVVASDASVGEGRLSAAGARKAAKLIELCDSLGMSVLTLVDAAGVADEKDVELPSAMARLSMAYLNATCPKVSVVVGKAYGAAFTMLGSRSLGADLALALPEAVISVMTRASAVAFLWNDRITADKDRAAVEKEWIENQASAERAAAGGDLDDIVPTDELRARLCSALYMLSGKASAVPSRRHANLPL
jgi:acetyl-CoA carboxylase carboxyltransferase component